MAIGNVLPFDLGCHNLYVFDQKWQHLLPLRVGVEPPNPRTQKKVATKVATFDTGLTKGKDEDDEEVGAMI